MSSASILATATRRFWDEYLSALVISSLWLLAQVLILPGPPATAALFAMSRATYDGTYWGAPDAWAAFREHFWAAWRWGLPNLLVLGLGLYNLSVFWNVGSLRKWPRRTEKGLMTVKKAPNSRVASNF